MRHDYYCRRCSTPVFGVSWFHHDSVAACRWVGRAADVAHAAVVSLVFHRTYPGVCRCRACTVAVGVLAGAVAGQRAGELVECVVSSARERQGHLVLQTRHKPAETFTHSYTEHIVLEPSPYTDRLQRQRVQRVGGWAEQPMCILNAQTRRDETKLLFTHVTKQATDSADVYLYL